MKQRVLQFLLTIPKGKVVTYGQIAAYLGNKGLARVVGNVLHSNPDPDRYPCYKVVNAQGKLAAHFGFGGLEAQRRRLEADGIKVDGDRVDLVKFGWKEAEKMVITDVVAALIWDGDRFMICQRPAHKARGLLWEFVGGKVEPGESKAEALIRECREELAITLAVGEVFMEVIHVYPDIHIRLTLFHGTIAQGTPQALEHADIRWIRPDEIGQYDFCPADTEILEQIRKVYG